MKCDPQIKYIISIVAVGVVLLLSVEEVEVVEEVEAAVPSSSSS